MNSCRFMRLASGLVVFTAFGHASEVHMQILKDAHLLGYATVSQWLRADGGKTVEMRMELKGPTGPATKLHKVSTYDRAGHPTRMLLEINAASRTETIVTFDESGAHVSRMVHGVANNSSVDRAPNSPWGDASEFWFLRDHPKPGDHFRTLLFSTDKLDWVLTDVTYLGQRTIVSGGRSAPAHGIRAEADGRSTLAYLDEHGDPIRLELDGGITMAQIVKKVGG